MNRFVNYVFSLKLIFFFFLNSFLNIFIVRHFSYNRSIFFQRGTAFEEVMSWLSSVSIDYIERIYLIFGNIERLSFYIFVIKSSEQIVCWGDPYFSWRSPSFIIILHSLGLRSLITINKTYALINPFLLSIKFLKISCIQFAL